MKLEELLGKLTTAVTDSLSSSMPSREAKDILSDLTVYNNKIYADDPERQKKMIALFLGVVTAAVMRDDFGYHRRKLYPMYKWEDFADSDNKVLYFDLGLKVLEGLPDSFNGNMFQQKIKTSTQSNNEYSYLVGLEKSAFEVDQLVAFCVAHKNDLESKEDVPTINYTPRYDNFDLVNQFIIQHKKSMQSGIRLFNRTHLLDTKLDYESLTLNDILEHAKKTATFGGKNRTRQILEKMGVINKEDGSLNINIPPPQEENQPEQQSPSLD